MLTAPFTSKEVCDVFSDIDPSKAPGKNGFPDLFFHKFWSVVCPSVTSEYLALLNDKKALGSLNDTVLALIPKVKNPVKMKDFWPIILCNVIYKTISKCITARHKITFVVLFLRNKTLSREDAKFLTTSSSASKASIR